jgi:hypothetical protein
MDLFPSRPLPPPAFVREALHLAGAESDDSSGDVLEVLLPGAASLERVTFEPDVAREERGVELAFQGSRFLDALIQLGLGRGRAARAFAAPAPLPPPNLGRGYQLRAEKLSRAEWADRSWTTWIFALAARFTGEFRQDALHLCAVDGASLRLVRRYEEVFSRLSLEDAGPAPEADRPFEECYRVALQELGGKAASGLRTAQRAADEDLARELDRLARYYDGLISEMGHDMERLAAEDPRRTAILVRLQATRADRDRTAAQTRERYRVNLELEVVGALGIVYPRRVARVTLADAAGREVNVETAWDPVFEQFEPLACPSCRRPTYALEQRGRTATCGCA